MTIDGGIQMNLIKQSYRAIKYHKRNTLLFFVFFSVFLILFVVNSQLILTQRASNQLIQDKWDSFKAITSFSSTNLHEEIIKNNHNILSLYNHYFILLITFSFGIFFLYGLVTTTLRRQEISYMKNLGLKKLQVVKHLYTELILISVVSFLAITFVLCVAQNLFIQTTAQINHQVATRELSDQKIIFNQISQDDASLVPTTKEIDKKIINSSQLFLPFNERSIFSNNHQTDNIERLTSNISRNFLFLIVLCGIATLSGSLLYLSFLYKRKVS